MASILQDRTTGWWTLKLKQNGKDKRHKLRRITPEEPRQPVPDDVLVLAAQHGYGSPQEPPDKPPDKQPGIQSLNPASVARLPHPHERTLKEECQRYYTRYCLYRAPSSQRVLDRLLKLFLRFASKHKLTYLTDVTVDHLQDFQDWRLGQTYWRTNKPVGKRTLYNELSILSGLFTSAVDARRIPYNPMSPVLRELSQAVPKRSDPKFLDPDEVKAVLAALDAKVADGTIPPDFGDITRIMLYSGLRVEAAVYLEYGWIGADWTIKVPASTAAVRTKTKDGYAAVLVGAGREVIQRRRQESGGTGRVFPNIKNQASVQHQLRKLEIHPHRLRHSFGTAAVDSKVPLQVIQVLMGHKSIATTAIYAQVRDQTRLIEADKIKIGEKPI